MASASAMRRREHDVSAREARSTSDRRSPVEVERERVDGGRARLASAALPSSGRPSPLRNSRPARGISGDGHPGVPSLIGRGHPAVATPPLSVTRPGRRRYSHSRSPGRALDDCQLGPGGEQGLVHHRVRRSTRGCDRTRTWIGDGHRHGPGTMPPPMAMLGTWVPTVAGVASGDVEARRRRNGPSSDGRRRRRRRGAGGRRGGRPYRTRRRAGRRQDCDETRPRGRSLP